MKTKLNFGQALEALKNGDMVCREGWNGKGMFVFKQIPAEISLDIIPKMQSVPQSVKENMLNSETTLKYNDQLVIVLSDGRVNTWLPSSEDCFAEDWCVLKN